MLSFSKLSLFAVATLSAAAAFAASQNPAAHICVERCPTPESWLNQLGGGKGDLSMRLLGCSPNALGVGQGFITDQCSPLDSVITAQVSLDSENGGVANICLNGYSNADTKKLLGTCNRIEPIGIGGFSGTKGDVSIQKMGCAPNALGVGQGFASDKCGVFDVVLMARVTVKTPEPAAQPQAPAPQLPSQPAPAAVEPAPQPGLPPQVQDVNASCALQTFGFYNGRNFNHRLEFQGKVVSAEDKLATILDQATSLGCVFAANECQVETFGFYNGSNFHHRISLGKNNAIFATNMLHEVAEAMNLLEKAGVCRRATEKCGLDGAGFYNGANYSQRVTIGGRPIAGRNSFNDAASTIRYLRESNLCK